MEPEHQEKHLMRNALIFSITIIACIGGYFYYTNIFRNEVQDLIEIKPEKIEFGTSAPQDFPRDILSETDISFEQSYSLVYPGQKQHTVVFSTTRSLEESQKMYVEYLKLNNWTMSSESPHVATVVFYATKESRELNIVAFFDESTAKNMVSISVLENTK